MSDVIKYPEADRKVMRSRMRSLLAFLPNLLKLLFRLMRDARVSKMDKAVLAGTILYVIAPLDFIPDLIPFIGQIDDIYLIAIALLRLINRTSPEVVETHWDGQENIKSLVGTISNVAQFFLPQRLRNVLVGHIEAPTHVSDFKSYADKRNSER